MKRYLILLLVLSFVLSGCITVLPGYTTENTADTGSTATEGSEPGITPGWNTEAEQTFYINPDGSRHTGWLELNGTRYYLDKDGVLQTGWLELDGETYYLKKDGSISRGKVSLNNRTYYFTSTGARIILTNPWNVLPADYDPDLVVAEDGYRVDRSCKASLLQMLQDCRDAGFDARITSAYRDQETQIELYNNKVWYFLNRGYEEEAARKEAATIIAVPGTSEHQLGLAVDLVDSSHWVLDESQEDTPAQKWLMEHCWEYGFILRYPNEKSEQTGIIYEPWHYRYVGVELAKELHTSGLCLEEYLNALY